MEASLASNPVMVDREGLRGSRNSQILAVDG